jgi:hypothetical protein
MTQTHDKASSKREVIGIDELEKRRRFLHIEESDLKNLAAVREVAVGSSNAVIERFYEHLHYN